MNRTILNILIILGGWITIIFSQSPLVDKIDDYLPKIKITQKIKDKVVAIVNGEKITKEELEEKLERYYGGDVLREIIKEKVILQEAKKYNILVAEAEVEEEIKKLKSLVGEERYQQLLISSKMDETSFKEKRKIALYERKLIEKIKERTLQEIKIDDKEIEENLLQVRCKYILVKDEKIAEEVYQFALQGEDFGKLAGYYSQDILTKDIGGDLGYITKGKMEKEIEEVIFSLKIGEITEPVKTKRGWHIIKCEEKKDIGTYSPEEIDEKKRNLREKKAREKAREYLKDLFKRAKIEIKVR